MEMMTNKLELQLQEDVLPWLYSKVDQFLQDDESVSKNTFDIVEEGIHKKQR